MSKIYPENVEDSDDELLPKYSFDYEKAKPNRFANDDTAKKVVILDEDVAKVFTTPESVNKALRALITAMP